LSLIRFVILVCDCNRNRQEKLYLVVKRRKGKEKQNAVGHDFVEHLNADHKKENMTQ